MQDFQIEMDQDCSKVIINKTISEVHTFLDSIANGSTQYKSVYNLTEQIEQQYFHRFLIELIQNAHDALVENPSSHDRNRIAIRIVTDESQYGAKYGALYCANDGAPFSFSNFESISNLGQSDKHPENSIGNKGIGFRSVLEITNAPEIYSRVRVNTVIDGGSYLLTEGPLLVLT